MTTAHDANGRPGSIVVKRRNVLQDVVRYYTVFIDDVAVGRMWATQTKAFTVAPGRHTLQLKIVDSGRSCSDVFQVDRAPGERVTYRTHSRGLRNALLLPFAMPEGMAALARNKKLESRYYEWPWIRIRREE